MRRFDAFLFVILLTVGTAAARAQAVSSATGREFSVTAGGMGSIFQPDFAGDWTTSVCVSACATSTPYYAWYPVSGFNNQPLLGVGAYVDVRLRRWLQIEAEGRWLRFNRYEDMHQDNYLIGPRLPLYRFGKATVYGKVLGGFAKMDLGGGEYGRFTDIAFGGGVDVKLTRRISLRALDAEYQYWPTWGNSTLKPYGASVGMSYKIF